MQNHARSLALAAILALGLAGCDGPARDASAPPLPDKDAADPGIARALNYPLMSDPDLARTSTANAVLDYADSSALPVLQASAEAARQARDAARAELLMAGTIAALPDAVPGSGGAPLGALSAPADILAALGAPRACKVGVRQGFVWAARLAPPAAILPLGMAEHAAGSDAPGCRVRLVRYLTAASIEDALTYHHALAQRAGMTAQYFAAPEAILAAKDSKGAQLRVHIRPAAGGMNAVDLAWWLTP